MHIPKTAGTSLREALGQLYRPPERLYLYKPSQLAGAVDPVRFADVPVERRAALRFVMGHFHYGLHTSIEGDSRYMTVLRDPVDRVISHYNHYVWTSRPDRRLAAHASGGPARSVSAEEPLLPLEEWIFESQLLHDNVMVRQIAGRGGTPFGSCPDDMLSDALEHIDSRFELVLVFDRMDLAPKALRSSIGVPVPEIAHRNATPAGLPQAASSPSVLEEIRELNQLDMKLYRTVRGQLS
jgi:hypothetical protein